MKLLQGPKTDDVPKVLKEFYEKGERYAAKIQAETGKSPYVSIGPKDDPQEWAAWRRYFKTVVGHLPAWWKVCEKDTAFRSRFTVPVRLPEWFDISYVPPEVTESYQAEAVKLPTPERFRDGQHIPRMRQWLSGRTGKPIAELLAMSEQDLVALGLQALRDELAPASSMANPHPLPTAADRTAFSAAVKAELDNRMESAGDVASPELSTLLKGRRPE